MFILTYEKIGIVRKAFIKINLNILFDLNKVVKIEILFRIKRGKKDCKT